MTTPTPSECAGPRAEAAAEYGDKPPPVPRDPRNPAEDEMTPQDDFEYWQEQRT